MTQPIAIVGAGMAGLACATRLAERGEQVVLFDKGRGPGGRMSARRASVQGETVRFDHGAQYFTARDDRFRKQVQDWQANGIAAPWPAAGENARVGTPAMNAPIRAMADRLVVEWGARVEAAKRQDPQAGEGWCVRIGERELPFERLVIAVPAEQVSPLLQGAAPDLAKLAQEARSDPCWALMLSFAEKLSVSQDVLRSSEGPISWAARDSAKPGRGDGERWVVHASAEFSREILEVPSQAAEREIRERFFALAAAAPVEPIHQAAHRWRFAKVAPAKTEHHAIWDRERGIGLAGDWLVGPRVEDAWLSGRALADMIAPG